jgi:hypothetical protein
VRRFISGKQELKTSITRRTFMANDQMEGVFASAIDLDWIPRYIIINKKGELFYTERLK